MSIASFSGSIPLGTRIGVAVLVGCAFLAIRFFNYETKVKVPVVGPGVGLTKWIAAVRNVWGARDSIGEGYFKIPTMTRMDVFLCDRAMTREYYSLSDEHMSFQAVMAEEFQFKYSLPGMQHNIRRIPNSVIAKALSWQRSRASNPQDPFFQEFSDEFIHGFEQQLEEYGAVQKQSRRSALPFFSLPSDVGGNGGSPGAGGEEWLAFPCFPLALKVVARLTTKALFSEPLCRDAAFLDLCCEVGDSVPRVALLLRCLPSFTRPLVAKFLRAPKRVKYLQSVILKEINSRRDSRTANPMKDILDFAMNWLDEQRDEAWLDWHITDMMTNTVFAALHTSSQLVVHTLFELATRPEYVAPLREEIEQCFAEHGRGSKVAIDSMHKMDSFIKETQRMNTLDASALARLVLKPYTFSNGLHVPEGTYIFTPNSPIYQDDQFYPDAARFDGFRFARMRDDPKLKASCPLTATNEQSMHFGIGRHACPGRYMVSDEVKLAMIHILANYDIAMENHGPRPKNVAFGKFILPDMNAKVCLRKTRRGSSVSEKA